MQKLAEGAAIALVSDAGTPLISDPGYKLVRAAQEAGYAVTAIPGASSILAALTVSGLPIDQSFLPVSCRRSRRARARVAELARVPATLIVLETEPRLAETLADPQPRSASARQRCAASSPSFMKRSRRAPLATLAHASTEHETRGEFVLVIAPPTALVLASEDDADALLRAALARTSLKDAVGEVAVATGLPRRMLLSAGARADRRKRPGGRVMARRAQPLRPPSAPKAERVAAFRLGLSAESRAAMFLIAKGYRILARRFKTPFGEIDIVARRRGALVFVEVKARGRADEAAEAVTGRGKQRIVAAAELWLARNPADAQQEIRFDVILVTPGKLPQHIPNAFDTTR